MTARTTNQKGSARESGLRELFIDELKDIYWEEQALPKMAKKPASSELIAVNEE